MLMGFRKYYMRKLRVVFWAAAIPKMVRSDIKKRLMFKRKRDKDEFQANEESFQDVITEFRFLKFNPK